MSRGPGRLLVLIGTALAVLLVAAACGETTEDPRAPATRVPVAGAPTMAPTKVADIPPGGMTPPSGGTVAAPNPTAGGGGGGAAQAVTVELVDIAFQPPALTVPANTPVKVTLTNTGASPHNFSVDQLGISVDVQPGATGETTINAPAGAYEYYCDVPGHKELGMVGKLTVK